MIPNRLNPSKNSQNLEHGFQIKINGAIYQKKCWLGIFSIKLWSIIISTYFVCFSLPNRLKKLRMNYFKFLLQLSTQAGREVFHSQKLMTGFE